MGGGSYMLLRILPRTVNCEFPVLAKADGSGSGQEEEGGGGGGLTSFSGLIHRHFTFSLALLRNSPQFHISCPAVNTHQGFSIHERIGRVWDLTTGTCKFMQLTTRYLTSKTGGIYTQDTYRVMHLNARC